MQLASEGLVSTAGAALGKLDKKITAFHSAPSPAPSWTGRSHRTARRPAAKLL